MKKLLYFFFSIILFCTSCGSLTSTGTIHFILDDGATFSDPNYSTTTIKGKSNSIIINGLPRAEKEGYYFIGWREYTNDRYTTIQAKIVTDSSSPFFGKEVYYYPYGTTTLYSYFEPLETFVFDLNAESNLNPKIVAPKEGEEDFDLENYSLRGYEKKELSSRNYLPTATCDNRVFSHWAIEYPLKALVDEQSKRTFFTVDYEAEKGLYNFLDFFKNAESISFPQTNDTNKTIKLIAIWNDDPIVTLHLGFDNRSVSFYAKNQNIYDLLMNCINESFEDIYEDDDGTIYIDNMNYKLIGCYLNSNYTYEFPISSSIAESSLDLYLLWGKKIEVTFDYNGGNIDGNESDTITAYGYENILQPNVFPTSELGYFNYYSYNNERVYFSSFKLPNSNCTFLAEYSSHTLLYLHYSFPTSYPYDSEVFQDVSIIKHAGEDISSELNSFVSLTYQLTDINNKVLEVSDLIYYVENKEVLFSSTLMPATSMYVYLKISYSLKVFFRTYLSTQAEVYSITTSMLSSNQTSIQISTLFGEYKNDLTLDSITYVYDGLYLDENFNSLITSEVISGSCSQETILTLDIYRKMVKGILITFNGVFDYSCYVKPSSYISNNNDKLCSLFNVDSLDDYEFYIEDNGIEYKLNNLFPSSDSTIIVKNKS